jgi:hypothetical protein
VRWPCLFQGIVEDSSRRCLFRFTANRRREGLGYTHAPLCVNIVTGMLGAGAYPMRIAGFREGAGCGPSAARLRALDRGCINVLSENCTFERVWLYGVFVCGGDASTSVQSCLGFGLGWILSKGPQRLRSVPSPGKGSCEKHHVRVFHASSLAAALVGRATGRDAPCRRWPRVA